MSKNEEADILRAKMAAKSGNNGGPLVSHSAADLSQVRAHRWAWHNRILIGYLNLIVGREGVGKGTLLAKLISELSKGGLEGNYWEKPISIGIIGDEDGFYDTWVPRLIGAGADLDKVWQIEQPDGGYISLTDDLDRIKEKIKEHDIHFLYFDQLLDNIGVKVDDWRGKQVRDALRPCRQIGKSMDIAVLAALHPNKSGQTFRNMVSGTTAFNQVSRSSLLLADDPNDRTKRVLVQGKGNYSEIPAGVAFRIESERHMINMEDHHVGVIHDLFESSLTVDDLISGTANGNEPTGTDMAEALIREMIPQDSKWHQVTGLYAACKEDGLAPSAIARARHRLGIENRRKSEPSAPAEWRWTET